MPKTFLGIARGLLFSPRKTFPELRHLTIGSAFAYFLITLAISVILTAAAQFLFMAAIMFSFLGGTLLVYALVGVLAQVVIGFIGGAIGAVITGAWIHLWVYVFGGRRGIGETLRVVFYAYTPVGLFGWIPILLAGLSGLLMLGFSGFLGWGIILMVVILLAILAWGFLITAFGITDFQDMPESKASNAVLVSFVIPLILALVAIFFLLPITAMGGPVPFAGGY
jgi:hypothetical protein